MSLRSAALRALVRAIGREKSWRVGRKLYLQVRGDSPNYDIHSNGEEALIRQIVEAGGATFWDVGANLGEWTATVLRWNSNAQVHAFEPAPAAFAKLSERLARTATHLHNLALYSEAGETEMHLVGAAEGQNSLLPNPLVPEISTETVRMERADMLADRLGVETIHLFKVDAEGVDFDVLLGAAGLFAAKRIRAAQFEYNWRWLQRGHSLYAVFEQAEQWGYRVARVTPGGLELFAGWHPEVDRFFECNYVLVEPEFAKRLDRYEGAFDQAGVFVRQWQRGSAASAAPRAMG